MRPNARATGWAMIALLMAAGGLRGGDAVVDELKALDGAWTARAGDGGEVVYTFKGDKLDIDAPNRSYRMTIKVDPDARPDKTIDFHIDEAPDDAKGQTSKGIYKRAGDDALVICFRPRGERPTKYEMVGFEQILTELTRKKK